MPDLGELGQGAYARGTITSSVVPVRFLRCVASSQKDKSGRSVVPVPGLQNAHIPRDWEPATNRNSAGWAARVCTVSYARVTDASRRIFPS